MNRYAGRLPVLRAVVLLILAFPACRAPEAPLARDVFRAAHEEDIQSWDPAVAFDETSLDVLAQIYEAPYQYDYLSEEYKLVPLLAADLPTFSEDRLTVRVPIRSGARFAADPCFEKPRAIRARDFVYALKRLALPSLKSNGWFLLGEKIAGMRELRTKLAHAPREKRLALLESEAVRGLRAENDSTLVIELLKPFPQILHILTMTFTAPIPSECVRRYAEPDGSLQHPVGTGAFKLKEWVRASKIVLERNPVFHAEFYPTETTSEYLNRGWLADAGKALPLLDGVQFEVFKDRGQSWQSFSGGAIDAIRIPKEQLQRSITNQVNLSPELAAKGLRLGIESGFAISYLIFNMRDPLVGGSHKAIRQAISSAIPREKWIDLVTSSAARKMTSLLPPGLKDRPPSSTLKYDYDLERARNLLARAGYPGGKGLPPITLDFRSGDASSQQLGEFFRRELGAIGIQVRVRLHNFGDYLERVQKGKFQLAYGNWGLDYPDAQNVLQLLYGKNSAPGPNFGSFNNARLNSLYGQMVLMPAGPERAKLIEEMDAIAQEELPWAPGFYYSRYTLTQPWVLNFRNNGMILNKYKYVRVNPALKARYLEVK